MDDRTSSSLASGRAALAAGDWRAARSAFADALGLEETPEALSGLAEAAWWLGETAAAVRYLERAHASFLRAGDAVQAVLAAIQLYFIARISLGRRAVANGWLRRAARLVDDHGVEQLRGWIWLLTAHATDDAARAEAMARAAVDAAERSGDADLELCARSQLGACLVRSGRIAEGTDLLDEAMAGALAGRGERLQTVVYTSCNTVTACSRVAEVGRALEWIRAGHAFAERFGCPHVFTLCRIHHARLMFVTGDWRSAEEHFDAALRTGREAEPALYGEALAGLAELRLAQGRLEDVAELVRGLEGHAAAGRVRAALLLALGDAAAAARLLAGHVAAADASTSEEAVAYGAGASVDLERAAWLALLVEAQAGAGMAEQARATAGQLETLGDDSGCRVIVAVSRRARAQALLAAGEVGGAAADAALALERFGALAMPLEAARCRLLLAEALADRERGASAEYARSALATFEELGASRDADQAAAMLRRLGVRAARRGPKGVGTLTKREREVLGLLVHGLSNRDIAGRLRISRRTVEHHVASVLAKLGLRSRTEAAVYARSHLP